MKRITELSPLSYSLKIARIVFLADLLLITSDVNAGGVRAEPQGSVSRSNKVKTEKKEGKMNVDETVKMMGSLCQYAIDGSFLIQQASTNIKNNEEIRQKLDFFKEKWEKHVVDFSDFIRGLGKDPPSYGRDFKGFLMQGWEAIRGIVSDKGTLQALQTNIKTLLKAYEEAAHAELSDDAKEPVKRAVATAQELNDYLVNQAIPKVA